MTVGASLTVPMALNPKTMGGALVEFSTYDLHLMINRNQRLCFVFSHKTFVREFKRWYLTRFNAQRTCED